MLMIYARGHDSLFGAVYDHEESVINERIELACD